MKAFADLSRDQKLAVLNKIDFMSYDRERHLKAGALVKYYSTVYAGTALKYFALAEPRLRWIPFATCTHSYDPEGKCLYCGRPCPLSEKDGLPFP